MPKQDLLGASRWVSQLPPFAQRAFQVDQMELDSALSQMYSLCVKPSLVGKMSKARKMTKNHYYRDDPAFIVLQIFFTLLSVIAYGLALVVNPLRMINAFIYEVIVDYFIVGAVLASTTWIVANRYLKGSVFLNELRREVEWKYSFDIHCNAYFVYFIWTNVMQYVLLPLLLRPSSFLSCLLANTLYAVGLTLYCYNVFLGYLELPVLTRQQNLLYPVPILIVCIVILTFVVHYNLTVATLGFY